MQLTDNKSGDIIIDTLEGNTLSDSGKILNQMGQVVTLVDIETLELIEAWVKCDLSFCFYTTE